MKPFKKTFSGSDFEFQGITEGEDEVCRVSVEGQQFKMTTDHEGNWQILQQVPTWIKDLEPVLGAAIDEAYN